MTEQQRNDPATPVPDAAPLRGEPAEKDQPDVSEVLPQGAETEVEHLVDDDDER